MVNKEIKDCCVQSDKEVRLVKRKRWNEHLNLAKKCQSALLLSIILLATSCVPTIEDSSSSGSDSFVDNTTVESNQSRVILTNPVVQSGGSTLTQHSSMGRFLSSENVAIIPNGSSLNGSCNFGHDNGQEDDTPSVNIPGCFEILKRDGSKLSNTTNNWGYSVAQEEFYLVNTFYHMNISMGKFYSILNLAMNKYHNNPMGQTYPPSIPAAPIQSGSYWNFDIEDGLNTGLKTLEITPYCDLKYNSYYDPTTFSICLGYLPDYPGVLFAQDPSVMYHEFGHAFIDRFFNLRNSNFDHKVSLGSIFYDEAGAINEGLADYFSFAMTKRTHIGEWALGKFLDASRPLVETDSAHQSFFKTQGNALSYPDFLNYNVYDAQNRTEDIHFSGQIISHFLLALTTFTATTCSIPVPSGTTTTAATQEIMAAIGHTLAELGDLTGLATDYNTDSENFYINLNDTHSFLWSQVVTPPNFRRFMQTFSKHFLHGVLIPHCITSKDQYEQLLDRYGLLLFSSYNDNFSIEIAEEVGSNEEGNPIYEYTYEEFEQFFAAIDEGQNFPYLQERDINIDGDLEDDLNLTHINLSNRQNTTMVSKSNIRLPYPNESNPEAYIFDKRSDIDGMLDALTFEGRVADISEGLASTDYNNSNGYISPGEIVGVALNLTNDSNSPLAGVQVLANDWDHMKYERDENGEVVSLRPCQINSWPLVSEGGQADNLADPTDATEGDCDHISRTNGENESLETIAPVCFVQMRNNNETTWETQHALKESLMLNDNECLNYDPDKSVFQDCFVRVIKPGQQAFMSKIDPGKTLLESLVRPDGAPITLNSSSAVFLEVNKLIPPGTIFMCRFRVRFSNCSDCYEDSNRELDDYQDFEYSGKKPFKVINYQFTIID
jgi:hypothetical protein